MKEVPEIPDEELIARTQAGDPDAFDFLTIRHSRALYERVYGMTSNHGDTNEIIQETLAEAYRGIGKFQRQANFSIWIHSIAADAARHFLTKHGRQA